MAIVLVGLTIGLIGVTAWLWSLERQLDSVRESMHSLVQWMRATEEIGKEHSALLAKLAKTDEQRTAAIDALETLAKELRPDITVLKVRTEAIAKALKDTDDVGHTTRCR